MRSKHQSGPICIQQGNQIRSLKIANKTNRKLVLQLRRFRAENSKKKEVRNNYCKNTKPNKCQNRTLVSVLRISIALNVLGMEMETDENLANMCAKSLLLWQPVNFGAAELGQLKSCGKRYANICYNLSAWLISG